MRKMYLLWGMAVIALVSCRGPECIVCSEVKGYPEGDICRDTYETTIIEGTPSWKDYTAAAIEDGCTVKND